MKDTGKEEARGAKRLSFTYAIPLLQYDLDANMQRSYVVKMGHGRPSPVQFGPGAQLSAPKNWTVGFWSLTVRGPICQEPVEIYGPGAQQMRRFFPDFSSSFKLNTINFLLKLTIW